MDTTQPFDNEHIELMIDIVRELYGNDLTNNQLAEYISNEFDCLCTENDVSLYLQSDLNLEIEDKKQQFKNLGLF